MSGIVSWSKSKQSRDVKMNAEIIVNNQSPQKMVRSHSESHKKRGYKHTLHAPISKSPTMGIHA